MLDHADKDASDARRHKCARPGLCYLDNDNDHDGRWQQAFGPGRGMIAAFLLLAAATQPSPTLPRATCMRTTDNRAIVSAFADLFYRRHDVKRAFETYVSSDYIQHNPDIADGRAAAIAFLSPLFATGETFDVRHILVDRDMAVIHLLAKERPEATGTAVIDMFRICNGKIVEHWDVLQAVPAQSKNPHPMF